MVEPRRVATFAELVAQGLLEIGDGYRAKLEELGGSGPLFLRAGLLNEHGIDWAQAERFHAELAAKVKSKIGRPGDTIVTTKGNSVGRTGYIPSGVAQFVYSPHLSYWRSLDTSQLSPGFLYYWSRSREFTVQLQAMAGSTDMAPYLSLTDQRRLKISLPEIGVQLAVSDVLSALDNKIAINSRITATSSDLISALYERAMTWPGSVMAPLTQVVEFDFGSPFSSKGFNSKGDGLPLLRIRDLKTFVPQLSTTERLAGDVVVVPGNVVAGMDAEFRPTFWLGRSALLNQRVLRGRSRLPGGRCSFVREVLRGPLREIELYKTGTTVIHLNKRDLELLSVAVPSSEALELFEVVADPLRERIVSAAQESAVLIDLRDTLLPGLMSGEIRVRDVEKIIEDAT